MTRPPDRSELNDQDTIDTMAHELKEKYTNFIKRANMLGALKVLDEMTEFCLNWNDDSVIKSTAHNCFLYLSPDLKYENLINQHSARKISDVTLFYLNDEIRKRTFLQSFATSRTLLTPHRRRQLAKTMNAEPRVFAFGLNSCNALGVDSDHNAYIDIPTEIFVPPVYEIKVSSTHTVFWCHDGQFFGCGETKNFMIALQNAQHPPIFREPSRMNVQIRRDEVVTGMKALESGTLFETNLRLYFIGDLEKASSYLKYIHDAPYELVTDLPYVPANFWVCHSRPKVSISTPRLDDRKNVAPMKILGTLYLIQVFPGYWTELNPGHVKRRPVLFLIEGVETRDVRIENVGSSTIWVVHELTLYHGNMTLIMKEDNNEDERDLDNYILFIELQEYRTPHPFVCTGVAANNSDGAIIKCGDFPCVCFDYLEIAENRYRGHVHKFMFETIERYMQSNGREFHNQERTDITMNDILSLANIIRFSDVLSDELKLDWMGRIEKNYRYSNFFSFLGYVSVPRLPDHPPKCFDTDIDCLINYYDPIDVARHRMKELFEEFERVNYPGTDVWKPTEFLREHEEPECDALTEGQYRGSALVWSIGIFIKHLCHFSSTRTEELEDPVNKEVFKYLINTIWFACNQYYSNKNPMNALDEDMTQYLEEIENIIPDDQLIFETLNPGKIVKNRLLDENLEFPCLDEQMTVKVKFTLEHRDPNLQATTYTISTCRTFLEAENPNLLKFIDDKNVLDLNKVYPDDIKLHRLIVQTHFLGHGIVDFEGCEKYENSVFKPLGYTLMPMVRFMRRGKEHFRGLLSRTGSSPKPLVSLKPTSTFHIAIETADGQLVYCHRLLRALYSKLPCDKALLSTLSTSLTLAALKGLLDKRILEMLPSKNKVEIVDWYYETKMQEAFLDLIKQVIIECRPHDVSSVRRLVEKYPLESRRFIAKYRPGILLWPRVPLPNPRIRHIKVIMDMWPKNDFERHTRVPQKKYVKNGVVEESIFRMIGSRELRRWYTNNEERQTPRFTKEYEKDFPLGYPYRPFKPTVITVMPPSVSSAAPLAHDRRKAVSTIAEPANDPSKEEKVSMLRKELEQLAINHEKYASMMEKATARHNNSKKNKNKKR